MALGLFRFVAAVGRTQVVANTLGTFTLLLVFVLGGFIIAKSKQLYTSKFLSIKKCNGLSTLKNHCKFSQQMTFNLG